LSELLPPDNKKDDEPYAELLDDLNALDVKTPQKLRSIITSHMDAIRQEEIERINDNANATALDDPGILERIKRGVFYAHVGLVRVGLRAEFGDDVVGAVMRKLRPPKHKPTRKRGG
jgi:hypothetical protein